MSWQNAPIDLVKAVFEICFHPAVQILLESHDHGEMQVNITIPKLLLYDIFFICF